MDYAFKENIVSYPYTIAEYASWTNMQICTSIVLILSIEVILKHVRDG